MRRYMKLINKSITKYVTAVTLLIPGFFLLMLKGPGRTGSGYLSSDKGKAANQVTVFVSSLAGDRLTRKPDLLFVPAATSLISDIKIDETIKYQKMEGFGATFNEAGMICLNSLDNSSRENVLRSLFDPADGAGYTLMKSPIAACDFASAGSWYSYNDTPGDTMMLNFSIERDLKPDGLIPFIT